MSVSKSIWLILWGDRVNSTGSNPSSKLDCARQSLPSEFQYTVRVIGYPKDYLMVRNALLFDMLPHIAYPRLQVCFAIRDTATDLPFTTVIQLNVHRQNPNSIHKAKGGRQRRNSLLNFWWKTSLAFIGLTHVVLTAEAFFFLQGAYFWFPWI